MKRFVVSAVFLAFITVASLVSAQSPGVAGEWDVIVNTTPQVTWHAVLDQKGEAVKGTLKVSAREQFALEGTLKGQDLKMTFTLPSPDGDLTVQLNGVVDGDSIKGMKTEFGEFGAGDWTGKRTPSSK